MERRAVLPTHRPPSQKASIAWLVVLICTIGAALLAVMVAAQDASAQDNPDPDAGWFQRCALTKTGSFDPIVHPGTPEPVGHRHLFFGSTAISPTSSTPSDLQAGSSTCLFQADSNAAKVFADGAIGGNYSSYWVPDLMVRNGTWVGDKPLAVNVTSLSAYYKKGAASIDPQKVKPFPSGLRMVIRDRNNNKTNVKWYCSSTNGEGNNGIFRDRPYDCDTTTPYKSVTARITFPQCGDGRLDDSQTPVADHISHMVYAGDNGCPKDHPQVFPRLFIHAKYDTSLGANSKLAIAQGEETAHADPATGFHADYFEAWQPGTLQYFVDHCIHAGINCRDGDMLP
jgi:cytochrome c-type biogenesis protein CcmH/NrfF